MTAYKFTVQIKLERANASYSEAPVTSIRIEETVPDDVEPVAYLKRRLTEEFERKVEGMRLPAAGLSQD